MYTGPLCPRHGKRARDRKPLGLSEQLTQSHVPEGLGGQSVGRRQATQAGCGLVDTCPVSAPVSRPLTVPSGVSGVTPETRAGPGAPRAGSLSPVPGTREVAVVALVRGSGYEREVGALTPVRCRALLGAHFWSHGKGSGGVGLLPPGNVPCGRDKEVVLTE